MDIRVFDLKDDQKVKAKCLLIDIKIEDYIELIETSLEALDIQRGKIISKGGIYKRLTNDLKEGTIMPPISLILTENSSALQKIKGSTDPKQIEEKINQHIKKGDLSILDGLQRTYCLLNVKDRIEDHEAKRKFFQTRLRAEVWYDMTYTAILYKMLVLNTGQIKMSMKHQIEILNIPLREKIDAVAKNKGVEVEFSTSKVPKTIKKGCFKFSDIVEALTSFITKDPIVDKTNVVVQELERMNFIESYSSQEKIMSDKEIEEFVDILIKIDDNLWNKYQQPLKKEEESELPWTSHKDIMGSPAILSGIFAAFGEMFNKNEEEYMKRKEKLFQILKDSDDDPLRFKTMSDILAEEKKKSPKFGETTRKFFFSAFREFFKGEDNFEQIWMRA